MEKLKGALDEFKKKNILVIGDILLDKFTWGVVERINPEQPAASLVKICNETYCLGGAGNVAKNISSLGAKCQLIGVIGNGVNGSKIINLCAEGEIEFKPIYNGEPTLVKQRIMAHRQQLCRLDFGEENLKKINPETQKKVIEFFKKELSEKKYDFIILSDYDKKMFDEEFSRGIITLANSHKIPIHVDPKPKNANFFRDCTVISPNEKEAEIITGTKYSNGDDILKKMSSELSSMLNSRYVAITCGKDGVFGYDSEKENYVMIPTTAREVADVTGAGDTFAAALPLALSTGLELSDAVRLANYASGVVVEKVGTATATIEEIKNKIDQNSNI